MNDSSRYKIESKDLVTQISSLLTEEILTQKFKPGERLSEVKLASELNVSRAPVREAARLLESKGLLVSIPRKGFYVRHFSSEDIQEIYDLRLILEKYSLTRVVPNISQETAQILKKQFKNLVTVAKSGNLEGMITEDLLFHRKLCELSGNERILKVFDELSNETRFCIAMIEKVYKTPENVANTHRPLLDAILSGDVEKAIAAIEHHLLPAKESVTQLYNDYN